MTNIVHKWRNSTSNSTPDTPNDGHETGRGHMLRKALTTAFKTFVTVVELALGIPWLFVGRTPVDAFAAWFWFGFCRGRRYRQNYSWKLEKKYKKWKYKPVVSPMTVLKRSGQTVTTWLWFTFCRCYWLGQIYGSVSWQVWKPYSLR